MNLIDTLFARLRASGRKAFIPFLPAGDPDLDITQQLLPAVAASGADLIEIGFPFSDPIADGPVIQASYTRALRKKLTLDQTFAVLQGVTAAPNWSTPTVAMCSYSLIHKRGPVEFLKQAQAAGLSGAVVPDLPVEEASELAKFCADVDFKLILLVTPTTEPQRAEKIVKSCGGFVYVVSVVGITGARSAISGQVAELVARLRNQTDLPLCIGFGISTPDQVKEMAALADGVIVGSALVKKLETPGTAVQEVAKLVKELSQPLRG